MSTQKRSDYLITNRRKYEEARDSMLQTTSYYKKTEAQSHFEEHSQLVFKQNSLNSKLVHFRTLQSEKLQLRKQQLKELFENDEIQYRQLLNFNQSTKHSRLEIMRDRVAVLKDRREQDRKAVCEDKLLRKWRAECDELRQASSKIRVKQVTNERAVQLFEKQQQKIDAQKEKEYYDVLWEQDRQKKIVREENDRLEREKKNIQMTEMLKAQISQMKVQAIEEARLKQEESLMMLKSQQNLKLEEENDRKIKEQRQREMCYALDEFNRERIMQKQLEANAILEKDLKILDEYVKQGELERLEKSAKSQALRKEMQMYRDTIYAKKKEEAERVKELDRLYQVADKELWEKKAAKWKKEQDARDKLMKEVTQARHEQLQYHLEQNRLYQEKIQIDREKWMAEIVKMQKQDESKKEKSLAAAMKYRDDLYAQIQKSRKDKLDEQHREKVEDEAYRLLASKYDEILEQEMSKLMSMN